MVAKASRSWSTQAFTIAAPYVPICNLHRSMISFFTSVSAYAAVENKATMPINVTIPRISIYSLTLEKLRHNAITMRSLCLRIKRRVGVRYRCAIPGHLPDPIARESNDNWGPPLRDPHKSAPTQAPSWPSAQCPAQRADAQMRHPQIDALLIPAKVQHTLNLGKRTGHATSWIRLGIG